MSANQKFASLQILRALAAWTVVFHHYLQWYFDFHATTPFGSFFAEYGAMGVDVFFVISGFVVFLMAEKSSSTPARFLVNRFFRIAPIYWFYVLAIVVCISAFPAGFAYTSYTLRTLIETIAFLPSLNPTGLGYFPVLTVGWTLNFEVFFYVMLAVCLLISRKYFLVILACILLISPLAYPKDVFYSEVAGSAHLWEFLVGALLAVGWRSRLAATFTNRYPRWLLLAVFLLFVLSLDSVTKSNGQMAIAGLSVLLALLLERYINHDTAFVGWMVKMGDESYSTYLAHGIVLGILINTTGKHATELQQYAILICYIVCVYVISALSYRYLERSRYLSMAQGWILARLGQGPVARAKPDHTTVS